MVTGLILGGAVVATFALGCFLYIRYEDRRHGPSPALKLMQARADIRHIFSQAKQQMERATNPFGFSKRSDW